MRVPEPAPNIMNDTLTIYKVGRKKFFEREEAENYAKERGLFFLNGEPVVTEVIYIFSHVIIDGNEFKNDT